MKKYFSMAKAHGTTVLAVRRKGETVLVADGQMTLGDTVFKNNVKKLRRLQENTVVGFAGAVADCYTLLESLEGEIEKYPEDTLRACINMAKNWRTQKAIRGLNASLVVADKKVLLNLDGCGNVIEIEEGVIGIGSGGIYAKSAATALYDIDSLNTEEVAVKSMKIAAQLCIYTNDNFTVEKINWDKI